MLRKNKKGFTLIELIMVIVILTALSFSAFLKMGSYNEMKLSSAASRLAGNIRYAQQLAISSQMNSGIRFDDTKKSYYLYQNTIDKNDNSYGGLDIEPRVGGIKIKKLEFDPWGRPYKINGIREALTSSLSIIIKAGDMDRIVQVSPVTGSITITN